MHEADKRNTCYSLANSSDSEDQCVAKSLMSKSSTQDIKAITPPKGTAQIPPSHKGHKHGDSEHLHPKEHVNSRGSRTYKWSFQMCEYFKQFKVIFKEVNEMCHLA